MEPGQSTFFYRSVNGGAQLAILSRGLQWEYSAGRSADLTFSIAEDTSAQQARLWQLRRRLVGGFSMLAHCCSRRLAGNCIVPLSRCGAWSRRSARSNPGRVLR